ncbi:uncharacterized protein BDZ99DRAFT_504292 [Mytilinidion resinicola]|uniref:RNase H type-1 domain-containing protein n=1 Tax=Mytilinidion resinicola TaxID=574789 RepID=A0A6A6XZG8_9PEZI|nr:uncharacterized protein BDZ99DRAFT_504292 [Mytilinidion resinicola]KAF2801800.1 hypothetical protein BDZ99DRAFT_504292 [Mytilinidion resinicola]
MDGNTNPSSAEKPAAPANPLGGITKYAQAPTDSSTVPGLAEGVKRPANLAATAPGSSFGVPPSPTSTPIQRPEQFSPAVVGHAASSPFSSSFARTLPAQVPSLPPLLTQAPLPAFSSLLSPYPRTLAHPLPPFSSLPSPHPTTLAHPLPQRLMQEAPLPGLQPLLPLPAPTLGRRMRGERRHDAMGVPQRHEDQKRAQRDQEEQRRQLKLAKRHAEDAGFHASIPTRRAYVPRRDPQQVAKSMTAPANRAHRARMSAFHKAIMRGNGGSTRSFAGNVIKEHGRASVATSITYEQALPSQRTHNAFWTDGSVHQPSGSTECFLGAAVARRGPTSGTFVVTDCPLGCNVGSSGDAEAYAIATALGLAVADANAGNMAPVVIFSDSLACLQGLESGKASDLGPLISTRWAFEDIYDYADQLDAMGVPLTLRWVNSHSGSKGNDAADLGANRAARMAAAALKAEVDLVRHLPLALKDATEEWEAEYWFRAKKLSNALIANTHAADEDWDAKVGYGGYGGYRGERRDSGHAVFRGYNTEDYNTSGKHCVANASVSRNANMNENPRRGRYRTEREESVESGGNEFRFRDENGRPCDEFRRHECMKVERLSPKVERVGSEEGEIVE